MATKYCRDCHFARNKYSPSPEGWTCASIKNAQSGISLVTGEHFIIFPNCQAARNTVDEIACGPEGRWFRSRAEVLEAYRRETIVAPGISKKMGSNLSVEEI